MLLNEFTSCAEISAAIRGSESAGPELCDPPNIEDIRATLIGTQDCDDAGNDFNAMWQSQSMTNFQEAIFSDYDRTAALMRLIGEHADDCPLLSASLDDLARELSEEL